MKFTCGSPPRPRSSARLRACRQVGGRPLREHPGYVHRSPPSRRHASAFPAGSAAAPSTAICGWPRDIRRLNGACTDGASAASKAVRQECPAGNVRVGFLSARRGAICVLRAGSPGTRLDLLRSSPRPSPRVRPCAWVYRRHPPRNPSWGDPMLEVQGEPGRCSACTRANPGRRARRGNGGVVSTPRSRQRIGSTARRVGAHPRRVDEIRAPAHSRGTPA